MNCFRHRDVPAIGFCKACDKGLCGECATELSYGLACKGSCEPRVEMINRMIDSNAKTLSAARHQVKTTGVISLVIGVGFTVFALLAYREMPGTYLPYLIGLVGVTSLATGFLRLSRREEYPAPERK